MHKLISINQSVATRIVTLENTVTGTIEHALMILQ